MTQQIGREEAIKRLKLHAKPGGELDGEGVGDRVSGETDRGAVIILAAAVEDALADKIREKMVWLGSDERTRMFGPDGPLGSFSALIRMAYALGIIDRELSKACDLIREMRNACAHSRRPISFKDTALSDCFRVFARYVKLDHKPDFEDAQLTKYWFGIFVGYVWRSIKHGREAAALPINAALDEVIKAAQARLAEQQTLPDKPK